MADSLYDVKMRGFFSEIEKLAFEPAFGYGAGLPDAAGRVASAAEGKGGTLGKVVGKTLRFAGKHWKPLTAAVGGAIAYHHALKIKNRASQLREYNRMLREQQKRGRR